VAKFYLNKALDKGTRINTSCGTRLRGSGLLGERYHQTSRLRWLRWLGAGGGGGGVLVVIIRVTVAENVMFHPRDWRRRCWWSGHVGGSGHHGHRINDGVSLGRGHGWPIERRGRGLGDIGLLGKGVLVRERARHRGLNRGWWGRRLSLRWRRWLRPGLGLAPLGCGVHLRVTVVLKLLRRVHRGCTTGWRLKGWGAWLATVRVSSPPVVFVIKPGPGTARPVM